MLAVCKNHNNRTCIAFDANKERVRFIISEEGVTEVRQLPPREFEREFTEIEGYPVLRAARLYLNPLTSAIEITAQARTALTNIINEEPSAMAIIEASTTEGQQNVNATIAAGLKTGTKGTPAPRKGAKAKPLPSAEKGSKIASAVPAKPAAKPTNQESAMTAKTTNTKKNAKTTAAKAPAKKAATKGGATKLVKGKGKGAAPTKKAAAKRNTKGLTPFASKADQKIKQHPDAKVRGGAMKELFDFVGKKGCTRAEAVAHMAKKDKEEGAEQRARNNISWGLRHDVFVEA